MPTYHDVVARLFARALADPHHVRHSLTSVEWDVSGACQSPVTREFHGVPSVAPGDLVRWRPLAYNAAGTEWRKPTRRAQRRRVTIDGKGAVPLTVVLHAKCRKCEDCLRKRAAHWRLRALAETSLSSRTWFGTLTFRPERHQHALDVVRRRAKLRASGDYDKLGETARFSALVAEEGKAVTLFLKRVRKASGARLRYLLVAEAHQSGLPHFHMLVHEWGLPVREALLSREWSEGFSKWRLAPAENPREAGYLCKYLSKDARARVRASLRYGRGPAPLRPKVIAEPEGDGVVPQPHPDNEEGWLTRYVMTELAKQGVACLRK